MKRFLAVGLLLLPSVTMGQEQGSRLNLVCLGAGSANQRTQTTINAWDSNGNTAGANVIGNRAVPFDDQVNVWIEGLDGRVRMPRAMLPPIRGGEGGWFKIKSIRITDSEITGSVAVNFMNNPKLRLDRLTGAISLAGKAGDYSGQCQKYEPSEVERAF